MKEQIKAIREKYGGLMLRMAIDHVIGVGINNLKNVNADEVCAQILKETPANSIMTPEFSAELMRCAIELSRVSIGDIYRGYLKVYSNRYEIRRCNGTPRHYYTVYAKCDWP